MALMITDDCISCGICIAECPNQAIQMPQGTQSRSKK